MSLVEHLEKLRHFYRISRHRSINEASQVIGVSQAGLSKSLSNLEGVLETQLFIRSQEGLILTREGQWVLETTERIIRDATELETRLRSAKALKVPERVKIGMYDSIAVYFYEDLKSYLKVIYPDVELLLTVDRSARLAEMTESGALDLAIGVNLESQARKQSEFRPLFEDHYSFYVSNRMESNLKDVPLILLPEAKDEDGTAITKFLAGELKKRSAHHVYNFETIKSLTLSGHGIGVLPTQVARPLVKLGQLRQVNLLKTENLFGRHVIGFMSSKALLKAHNDFAQDIFRLGERWSQL